MTTKLVDVSNDYKEQCKILTMMRDEVGIKEVFSDRIDRLVNSAYSFMIKKGSKDVGFVNLVVEKQDYNFYFLDVGLKKEYRNKGIGTFVLKKMQERSFEKFIILEVKVENETANLSIGKVGVKLMEEDGVNYYLLQKDKVQEFIDNDYLTKLSEHIQVKRKRDLLLYKK